MQSYCQEPGKSFTRVLHHCISTGNVVRHCLTEADEPCQAPWFRQPSLGICFSSTLPHIPVVPSSHIPKIVDFKKQAKAPALSSEITQCTWQTQHSNFQITPISLRWHQPVWVLLICLLYCSFLGDVDTVQEFPDILVLDRSGLLDQGSYKQSKTINLKQEVHPNSLSSISTNKTVTWRREIMASKTVSSEKKKKKISLILAWQLQAETVSHCILVQMKSWNFLPKKQSMLTRRKVLQIFENISKL